jgi:plasmid stability protein
MHTMIQIRNVPTDLHRRAKARASLEGMTLSDFAKEALRRAVDQPTMAEVAARIRQLHPVECAPSAADLVREDRDSR